jgi:6-phosphofructokinase 1
VAKTLYEFFPEQVDIYGIAEGYRGLIEGVYKRMHPLDFSGILTLGGTILGTSRQPFKDMQPTREDEAGKVPKMIETYRAMRLDALVVLGGNGTHKTADLLSREGLNIVTLPKTIDNDLWGTDITFGFQSAVDLAVDMLDRLHTTATAHNRTFLVELMGNKAGWLTLYGGVGGGADIILLPEFPFHPDEVVKTLLKRERAGKRFSIVAVAEGAVTAEEHAMGKKAWRAKRAESGQVTATAELNRIISQETGFETRTVVPGHLQRAGAPSPYDRILSTLLGAATARFIREGRFGVMAGVRNNAVVPVPLSEVAGKTKLVQADTPIVQIARDMGICLGG